MTRPFGLCLALLSGFYSTVGLAYGGWHPGMPTPPDWRAPPTAAAFRVHSFWDEAGDYRIRIAHRGLKPHNIRLRLLPGRLTVEVRQHFNQQSPYGRLRQSSNMVQSVSIPRGVDPRQLSVIETNSGVDVRIPARRFRP